MIRGIENPLPAGWAAARIGEIAQVNPSSDGSSDGDNPAVSFVPMAAVEAETGVIELSRTRRLDDVRKGYRPFRERDVLFAKITPCMENGKMAVVPRLEHGLGFGSTEFHVLRPHREISPDYLYRLVSAVQFRRDAERHMTGAVGQRRVPTSYLADQLVRLPPTAEQRRVVAKIDELFSEMDKGINSLKTVLEQINIYRQALLKQAFEGKLSGAWREHNKDQIEASEQLTARIKKERTGRYERRLTEWKTVVKKWEASGKTGKKPSRPRKPAELPRLGASELAVLPTLPKGYTYTYLAHVGELERGTSKHRPRNAAELFGGPYPFIQTEEVKAADHVIRDHNRTYNELGLEQSKLWPKGTLCITIAANIAETSFLGFDSCFPDSVVGFTAIETLVLPRYVELFIKSIRTSIEAYAPATAQKNINLAVLESIVIPLCSLQEQRALLDRLDAILSVVDEQKRAIERHLRRADALRQSILKKAFTGRLVMQDADDEPASVLIERIRAEREHITTHESARKKRKRKTTKVTA